jgi:hypothetical protein
VIGLRGTNKKGVRRGVDARLMAGTVTVDVYVLKTADTDDEKGGDS